MNETRWTPGPWILDEADDPTPNDIRTETGELLATAYEMDDGGMQIAVRNARLMAEAPALYEALVLVLRLYKTATHRHPDDQVRIAMIEEAEAALSRARGEEPTE